jgi:hypothetical protein
MTRSVLVCVTIVGVFAAMAPAHADTGMLPNGATITFNRVFIKENGSLVEPSTPDTLRQYLNLAHCVCSQAAAGPQQTISYEVGLSLDTNTNRPGELWVGTQCDDDTVRNTMCRKTGAIPDIDVLAIHPDNVEVSLYDAINGTANTAPCQQRAGDAFLWVLVDSNGDNVYDYFKNQSIGKTADVNGIDTEPPPLPTNFQGYSAENAIKISWTVPEARATDIFYYQALCVGPDGTPVTSSPHAPRYQTVRSLCGLEQDIALTASDIATSEMVDAGAGAGVVLPAELQQLDPAFICGDSTDPTATSLLIENLKNDVPYKVVLLAIDFYGNATGTYFTSTITPKPATDFWEDFHARGGAAEGGFCLIAETFGDDNPVTQTLRSFRDETLAHSTFGRWLIDAYYGTLANLGSYVHGSIALRVVAGVLLAPLVVIALVWHTLTLPGLLALLAFAWMWRRRRNLLRTRFVRTAIAAGLTALVLAPGHAHAQGAQPYWETDPTGTDNQLLDDVPFVQWHVGIRVGPYTPSIDGQTGMNPGPYAAMYGGSQALPMLDIDRILWRGFGQFGVGGSIGYMQKSGYSFVDGSDPNDPTRPRSMGDKNTFRLIPLAATLTYRLTWFDDEHGIPIVPYVRGGLSYYSWWVSSNGKTASVCKDGGMDPTCDKNKAIGASLGFQGSVGLAVRAERIDASAAQSMRQGGIEHAGFYGELSFAKVDGFGSPTKLSVGDKTWFLGVDFEF